MREDIMLRQNLMLFYKTKQCFFLYIIGNLLLLGYLLVETIFFSYTYGQFLDGLDIVQLLFPFTIYSGIVFLLLGYEYMGSGEKYEMAECLDAMAVPFLQRKFLEACVLFLLVLFQSILVIGYVLLVAVILGERDAFIFYMLKAMIVYFTMPNLILCVIGMLIQQVKKRLVSSLMMLFATVYMTIRFYQLFYGKETLYGISDATQFFGVGTRYVGNISDPYPISIHIVSKSVYILAVCLFFLLLIWYWKSKKKCLLYAQAGLFLLFVGNVILWNLPCSGNYEGYEDQSDALYQEADALLQQDKPIGILGEDTFWVTNYEMEVAMVPDFKATVKMQVSDTSLPEYSFTLYSRAKIKKVADQKGERLSYKREGNFFTVYPNGKELSAICVVYEGSWLNRYYASASSAYLPGNFPYYPISGKRPVDHNGLCTLPEQESTFSLTVKGKKHNMISNLEQKGTHFSGMANQVTLLSGNYRKYKKDGIIYIYPAFSAKYDPQKNHRIHIPVTAKTVVISPLELSGIYLFGSDIVIWRGIEDDVETYQQRLEAVGEQAAQ